MKLICSNELFLRFSKIVFLVIFWYFVWCIERNWLSEDFSWVDMNVLIIILLQVELGARMPIFWEVHFPICVLSFNSSIHSFRFIAAISTKDFFNQKLSDFRPWTCPWHPTNIFKINYQKMERCKILNIQY